MKKVLISISAKWCEMIFSGEKTIEVRKSHPSLDMPFKVYVYMTKHKGGKVIVSEVLNSVYGGGKVIGSFVCDRIRKIIPFGLRGFKLGAECLKEMCLSKEQLDEYGGLKTLYSWHITDPKLFDKPKELSEFYIPCKYYEKGNGCPEDCGFFKQDCIIDRTDDFCEGKRPIIRPPQSWCYVDELQ